MTASNRDVSQRDLRALLVEAVNDFYDYIGQTVAGDNWVKRARAALAADEHGAAPSREPSEAAIEAARQVFYQACRDGDIRSAYGYLDVAAMVRAAYAIDGVRAVDRVGPEPASDTRLRCREDGAPLERLNVSSEPEGLRRDAKCPKCGRTFMVTKATLCEIGRPTSSTDGATT